MATLHNYRLVCPSGRLFRDGAICHDCVGRLPLPALRHGCYRGSRLATLPMAASGVVNGQLWRTRVSAYICISQAQREIIRPFGLPDDRVFVRHNLVPPISGSRKLAASEKQNNVVFLGRIADVKGIELLMEAWDLYSATSGTNRLRLVIAGSGPLEADLTAWARGRHDVDFLGILSSAQCQVLLQGARAAVIPSAWEEPFGMVVVEAMAAGVPVIASAHGSFPDLLIDGREGTLFQPGNASALAEALQEVETAPERYERYGYNARDAYEKRFNFEANLSALLAIYGFAIERPAWTVSELGHHSGAEAALGRDRHDTDVFRT